MFISTVAAPFEKSSSLKLMFVWHRPFIEDKTLLIICKDKYTTKQGTGPEMLQ